MHASVFYAAEVISLTAGLFLFFCQGLVGFVPGMKDLGFAAPSSRVPDASSSSTRSASCWLHYSTQSVPRARRRDRHRRRQPLAFCAFWFFAAIHLVYVAFALHVVDKCGGAKARSWALGSIFLLFFVHMFVGWNAYVIIPLPWYHQTRMFTEVFGVVTSLRVAQDEEAAAGTGGGAARRIPAHNAGRRSQVEGKVGV